MADKPVKTVITNLEAVAKFAEARGASVDRTNGSTLRVKGTNGTAIVTEGAKGKSVWLAFKAIGILSLIVGLYIYVNLFM